MTRERSRVSKVDVRQDPYTGRWVCQVYCVGFYGSGEERDPNQDMWFDSRMDAIKGRDILLYESGNK